VVILKIDIHITDATPIEAQRILIGMQFADHILGNDEPRATVMPKKQPADPTCDEETGCKGCIDGAKGNFGKVCEECSPPPAPIAPKLKARHNPPEKTAEKKKTGPKTDPAKVNQYGIPSELYRTDKNLYQRLWGRCKKHGIKYEAALAMEATMRKRPEKKAKAPAADTTKDSAQAIAPSNEAKAPKKPKVKKPHLLHRMKNAKPPEAPPQQEEPVTEYPTEQPHTAAAEDPLDPPLQHDDTPETYTVKGLDQDLADALPEERPPTGHEEKREAAKTMENIKIGDQVRQVAGLKICAGIGTIKRAVPGDPRVLVAFGNGTEWLDRKCLAPVMAS
jgi:hypothetical protein